MMMAVSEKQKAASKRWISENYTQVKLSMSNQEAKALADYCAAKNISKAGLIRRLIKETIENDTEYQAMEKNKE